MHMGIVNVEKNKITFRKRDEIVVIEPWGKDILRFRSTPNGKLTEQNWNIIPQEETKCETWLEGKCAVIKNGSISAKIQDNGKVTYYKNGVELLSEKSEFAFESRFRYYRSVGTDTFKATVYFNAYANEHFYGLGQDPNDCFDLKGTTSDLHHKNAKSSIPFVYSSRGYGFLWNNPSVGRCELANNRTLWEANCTKQVDYFIIAGETPKDIMKKYADLTGYAPKFPSFASGFWQSKLRYESQEDLLAVAREYKKRGIPLSAIVIDFFHWTEQGDWKFDPTYWPNPKEMTEELKEMGIQTVVSIWPTTNPKSENYRYMDDRNMLIRTENGQYGLFDFYGLQTYIDPSNPETREYVWNVIKKNYYDNGIKCFWLDQAEPEILPNHYNNMRMYLGNGEEVALLYPYYYAKLFYDGMKKEGETDIISLVRAAWIGSQRFGTLVWSGDIPSTFESLRKQVKVGLNTAMSGIPWWTTDIGGFYGGDIESDYFKELIVRWFQFGVFCPVTRLHGTRIRPRGHVDRHPEVPERSGGDNEIWSFGEEVYIILKDLINLRERLRPYVEKYMDIAGKTGSPVMRPMFFEFPEDEVCYTLGDQYMFGEDILFAPIVNQGETKRTIYLPQGKWVNVNDKKIYDGGQFVEATAEINQFVAFVKNGSDIINIFCSRY